MKLKFTFFRLAGTIIISLLLYRCSPYLHQVSLDSNISKGSQLVELVEKDYPFTSHKKIDWKAFSDTVNPLLSKSIIEDQDYLELRRIVYGLADSRINLDWKKNHQLKKEETGGYIGFDIAFVPPGDYFVSSIDSLSEAWTRGIRVGDKIIGWDQKNISEAIESFPLRWGFHPATPEIRHLLACHFICRGKAGSYSEVFYVNGTDNNKGLRLKYLKQKQSDYPNYLGVINRETNKKFDYKVLNDSIGYFRIDQFTPRSLIFFNRKVLGSLDNISGLIIDLRQNTGGYDPIAVKISESLISEDRFYEEAFINEGDDIHTIGHLIAHSHGSHFDSPIIIITGPLTMGVAEGFANLLKEEDHIRLLASWNTAGSFSLPGGQIKLVNGIRFHYPIGGSMDENHRIIIESGANTKGLAPNVYIRPTKDVTIQMNNGVDVILLEAINHLWRR